MSRLTPQTPLEKLTGKLKPQPWGNAQAAVAILVKPKKDDLEFFLVKRAEVDDDPWSGDMAFPEARKTSKTKHSSIPLYGKYLKRQASISGTRK